jgi:hypothetical protein
MEKKYTFVKRPSLQTPFFFRVGSRIEKQNSVLKNPLIFGFSKSVFDQRLLLQQIN